MRPSTAFAGLLGLFATSVAAQDIDIDGVIAAGSPDIVTPAFAVASQTASVVPIAAQASAAAASAIADLTSDNSTLDSSTTADDSSTTSRRSVQRSVPYVSKRDGTCSAQPAGYGPVASPDTPANFVGSTTLSVSTCLYLGRDRF